MKKKFSSKIAVTGASGMLGLSLINNLSKYFKVFATSRFVSKVGPNIEWVCFDLTNTKLLEQWLNKIKPDLVIHCAAIVDVDLCEVNVHYATLLHKNTTEVIAKYSHSNKIRMIYISTDSVFDGKKKGVYNEFDKVNPLNIYAKTKYLGEKAVHSIDNGLILRVNIIGWTKKNKDSFAEMILKNLVKSEQLKLFYDVNFSPLTVYDLSKIINKIIRNPISGLYHCGTRDSISKYGFGLKMAEIFQLSDSNIKKISLDDIELRAARPKNMALDVNRISKDLGINLPGFEDSIKRMKKQYDLNKNLLRKY